MPATAAFYFDLASPLAYLAAEQALTAFADAGEPVEWIPVSIAALPGAETFEAPRCQTEAEIVREEVERRARELHLQPFRWPDPFPFDSALAMRVATYAKSIGRTVPFAQAAFRQAFAGGRALDDEDSVVIAAAACEMHPAAVLKAAATRAVADRLAAATADAAQAGVRDVPAVVVGKRVFHGERGLAAASAELSSEPPVPAAAGPARNPPLQIKIVDRPR